MIYNFTKNHQFTIRMIEDHVNIEVVNEIKLLGTWITSDLSWDVNTNFSQRRHMQDCNYYTKQQHLQKAREI